MSGARSAGGGPSSAQSSAAVWAAIRAAGSGSSPPNIAGLRGPLTALAAWPAGRAPQTPLDCERAGAAAPLPALRPWP
ncbi:hypothetical protein ABT168_30700 [Streptomyces sp. NPDC001793]|uniref:hypothetical protein n=1 Tax=Streptomyces sp. NPDC001793 TaxID=3154657 RepID=UPI003330A2F0